MKNLTDADVWAANQTALQDAVDALNEANFTNILQIVANRAKHLYDHKAWVDQANTFTAAQTVNGAAGDANAVLLTTTAPTNFRLLWQAAGTGATKPRIYVAADGSFVMTVNARWDPGTTNWVQDDVAINSNALFLGAAAGASRVLLLRKQIAGTGPWATGSWSRTANLHQFTTYAMPAAVTDSGSHTIVAGTYADVPGLSTITVVGCAVDDVVDVHCSFSYNSAAGVTDFFARLGVSENGAAAAELGLTRTELDEAVVTAGYNQATLVGRHTVGVAGNLVISLQSYMVTGVANPTIKGGINLMATVYRNLA
jgi:hypothetical protein